MKMYSNLTFVIKVTLFKPSYKKGLFHYKALLSLNILILQFTCLSKNKKSFIRFVVLKKFTVKNKTIAGLYFYNIAKNLVIGNNPRNNIFFRLFFHNFSK